MPTLVQIALSTIIGFLGVLLGMFAVILGIVAIGTDESSTSGMTTEERRNDIGIGTITGLPRKWRHWKVWR
jgi:hypothetical protein